MSRCRERTRRLQMGDAAHALKLLALAARDLPKAEDRKEVHQKMLDVARRALGGGYVGVGDVIGPIPPEIKDPVEKELARLGIRLTFPSKKMQVGDKEQEIPPEAFNRFQQESVGGMFAQLSDMISKPVYKRLSDEDEKLMIDDFKRAWSENDRRRLHGQLISEGSGASARERSEAQKELVQSRIKERQLQNKDAFVQQRQIQRRLKPRLEIQIGESPQ